MPGLIRAENTSFLGQMKVSISRTPAPKQVHSVISSRAFAISLDTPTHYLSSGSLPLPDTRATRHPTLSINDLPPEILAEIFHAYLFWEDESDLIEPELEGLIPVIEPSSRAAPLLFCQVCSYWREVAISTPSLWSSIALKETILLNTVKLWLQRSRNHPLSFAIWLSSSPDNSTDKWSQWPQLLNLLCGSIHRWRDVLVHVPTTANMPLFMDALLPSTGESAALMLRTLDVSKDSFGEQINEDTIRRLSSFPHPTLRRLTWEGATLPTFQQLDTVLWTNLLQLTFVKLESYILFAFLEACPNIQFLSIGTLLTRANSTSPDHPVLAPKLQALHIGDAGGDVTETLQCIISPRLTRLSFKQSGRGFPGATGRLLGFISRSQCRLTSLSALNVTRSFNEDEARVMLLSKTITDIPHVSLRMPQELCHPSFPQAIIAEVNSAYDRNRTYAYLEPINYCYHLGWGAYDFTRQYARYPFIRKSSLPKSKWYVFLRDGPLTSA
ncbi:hypothetical protein BJ165DRAFT_1464166 [Panaeolus papilionaceus]|nr:hypothetical protein BJ165DRAFT_1464166 [Panaeolus papilionaceus]